MTDYDEVAEECGKKAKEAAEHLNASEGEDRFFWIDEFQFWSRQAQLYLILADAS